jgi:renalase
VDADVIVVGAGVAGLSCARLLSRAGRRVIVLDKSKGVGGRCATRRILEGQAVDHGVAFLHGSDASFLSAIDEIDTPKLEGWPYRVEGRGVPCQPDTYTARDRRVAFVEGISSFPKHLARGLDVRKECAVSTLQKGRVLLDDGSTLTAKEIVLTLPVEQLALLLGTISAPEVSALLAARTLLGWLATVPCLTVIAAYDPQIAQPTFDVLYPDEGPLQVILHDSTKRADPTHRVLVFQAGVRASEAWLELPPEAWQALVLEEAGKQLGTWASTPRWASSHRWRHARFPAGAGLGGPLHFSLGDGPLGDGTSLGLAGEAFGPHGGVQGAFLSGEHLARRMLGASS